MSTTIVYAGRARREGTEILIEAASQDNNVFPKPHKRFGQSSSDFSTYRRFEETDVEGLAQWVEGLASSYSGDCITERGKHYTGPAAYKLWATRIKKGTGIVLRAPRLSEIVWGNVPSDISGSDRAPRNTRRFEKGQSISHAEAYALVEAGVTFRVNCTPTRYAGEPYPVRLGFIAGGELYYFVRRSHRRGRSLDSSLTLTLLHGIEPDKGALPLIPAVTLPGIEKEIELARVLRDDLFVMMEGTEGRVLRGPAGNHEIGKPNEWSSRGLPTVFADGDAQTMLARLNQVVPELAWKAVSLREYAAQLMTHAIAA